MKRGVVLSEPTRVQTVTHVERLRSLATFGIQPQGFVRQAKAWPQVEAVVLDVPALADLVRRRSEFEPVPTLEKLWAEAVYEAVRARELPNAPSRLDCVYAAIMGYDAFSILPELNFPPPTFDANGFPTTGPMIVPAMTRGRWVAVDMHLFALPLPLRDDEVVIKVMLAELDRLAGDQSGNLVVELLCEGLDVEGWGAQQAE